MGNCNCTTCGRPTPGTYSEGGALWRGLCPDCFAKVFAAPRQESILEAIEEGRDRNGPLAPDWPEMRLEWRDLKKNDR